MFSAMNFFSSSIVALGVAALAAAGATAQAPEAGAYDPQLDAAFPASNMPADPDRLPRVAAPDLGAPGPSAAHDIANEPLPPGVALHHCIGSDGMTIFTDHPCDDVQAVESQRPQQSPLQPGRIISVRSCARTQDDLVNGVRAALENHDVNRFAEYYDWAGMGSAQGYRLMDRMEAFSARPLMDVQLMTARPAQPDDYAYPQPTAFMRALAPGGGAAVGDDPYASDAANPDADANADADATSDPFAIARPEVTPLPGDAASTAIDPTIGVPAPRPRPARLLRVDQMTSDSSAASQVTYFQLRSNAGCWWLHF